MEELWKSDSDWADHCADHWERIRACLPARTRGIISAMRVEAAHKGASLTVGGSALRDAAPGNDIELVWLAAASYPRSKRIKPPMSISSHHTGLFLNQLRASELYPYQILEHHLIVADAGTVRSAWRIRAEGNLAPDPTRARTRARQLLSAPKQLLKMQGLKLAREKTYPALIAYAHFVMLTHGEIPLSLSELPAQARGYDHDLLAEALESYLPQAKVTMGPKSIIDLIEKGIESSVTA